MSTRILCVTGHRPGSLGSDFPTITDLLFNLAVMELQKSKPSEVITGMALGWDMAVADACVHLDIPFIAAIPFDGQELYWVDSSIEKYRTLLNKASAILYTDNIPKPAPVKGFAKWKYLHRNKYMVDSSDQVLALWNGSNVGGTAHCVKYAEITGRPVINCWEAWNALTSGVSMNENS